MWFYQTKKIKANDVKERKKWRSELINTQLRRFCDNILKNGLVIKCYINKFS